ncbi:MAG TPA: alpha-ketoacid dehydrogenase subunit beta [Actinomycetota bacterium]|nr:alpha-ketoacid dehydrogenase subunit beta [Actinomycetota bacterium]
MAKKSLIKSIHDTMWDLMAGDERVLIMGEDVGTRGGVFRATEGFVEKFGEERVIDAPLAESSIVGHGIGMALGGLLPILEIQFADFIHPAFNQIVQEAARLRYRSNGDFTCPIVIRAPYGAGVHGGLYHSQSVEALFAHVPGLKIVMPSTPYDAKGLLRSALYDPDPVLYFEHKKCYRMITGEVPDEDYDIPIGKAEIKRKGDALTVIAYGLMLHHCLAAAERLSQEEGLEAEVLDPRSVAPMDWPAIFGSVTKTSKAMIVYEDNRTLGVGAEISARIGEELFYDLEAPVVRIGSPDVPATPYSRVLEEFFLPKPDQIYAQMLELARY